MSTEYRRGIPSATHIEAASRLGLLWEDTIRMPFTGPFLLTQTLPNSSLPNSSFRPIRPIRFDGMPVDWEVLDQEVARVGQQGQPATVTPTASTAPAATQPQGFRADLWRQMCQNFIAADVGRLRFQDITELRENVFHFAAGYVQYLTDDTRPGFTRADILARWAIYQELKPLYDIVDGAQGEATMPRDVEAEWHLQATTEHDRRAEGGRFGRDTKGVYLQCRSQMTWRSDEDVYGVPLRNFAAVLDAVAEQRVAACLGQTQPVIRPQVQPPGVSMPIVPITAEPTTQGTWARQAMGRGVRAAVDSAQQNEQRLAENPGLWREAQRQAVSSPRTADMIYQDLLRTSQPISASAFQELQEFTSRAITQVVMGVPHSIETDGDAIYVNLKDPPLPRFTADELNDVDHSAATTQDSATLKRGKLPTVEAIGKYREVMAKRNGTVAEAVKASGIDCEVAQYVLERWGGGLSDGETQTLMRHIYFSTVGREHLTKDYVDRWAPRLSPECPTLDTSEPIDTEAQRQRAEAKDRRARMAAVQAQLAKERAARIAEPLEEPTRFSLLEVDEAADPARSIEAWKAKRARNVVRPVAVPTPQPAPKRKPFDVIDAQADGLSGSAALAVLLGRAMNAEC